MAFDESTKGHHDCSRLSTLTTELFDLCARGLSFIGKPDGIVSNSPGPLGGVSAAKHLQNILPGICGPIMQQPETYLNGIGDAFDEKGELVKESLKPVLQQYLNAFAAHDIAPTCTGM